MPRFMIHTFRLNMYNHRTRIVITIWRQIICDSVYALVTAFITIRIDSILTHEFM